MDSSLCTTEQHQLHSLPAVLPFTGLMYGTVRIWCGNRLLKVEPALISKKLVETFSKFRGQNRYSLLPINLRAHFTALENEHSALTTHAKKPCISTQGIHGAWYLIDEGVQSRHARQGTARGLSPSPDPCTHLVALRNPCMAGRNPRKKSCFSLNSNTHHTGCSTCGAVYAHRS